MRKILIAATGLAALAGPAFAADLPSQKEAPVYVPPPPAFTWTGFYIGADVGGGIGSKTVNYAASPLNPAGFFDANFGGVVGGGFVGYNYQINQFVIGVQGDIQGAGISGSTYASAIDVTTTPHQDWLAAINGRLGFALDHALFYAIGGVAFTEESHTVAAGTFLAPTLTSFGIPANAQKFNWNRTGYDVGGGIEYAFTPNWTGRIEYRYYDFGSWNYYSSSWVGHGRENLSDNTLTVGVSYLFGAPAAVPVVAKY
jgi:outer membrane immunogenic protein